MHLGAWPIDWIYMTVRNHGALGLGSGRAG